MASQNNEILRRLKSNHYLDNIGLLFKSLYSNDNLADVTISCRDGPTIEAHKIVLSACSSYFHELLSKKTSHPVFIMHKISYQDMLYLLEFMYKGVIDVPEDNVDHLIKIAKELEITDFCLPEHTQPTIQHNSNKKKLNHIDNLPAVIFDQGKPKETITIPEIEVVSLTNSPPPLSIRKSISDRSISDVNENQTSSLSRNTRFKGKKRVPVCETIDVIDNNDISPRSLLKKKSNSSFLKIKDNHPIQHSTPNPKDDTISNFVIKDISGGNGSIILNYKTGKETSKLSTKGPNDATTSSSSIPTEPSSNFTVKVSPDDLLVDIETVTPDIEIVNESNPISLDDSLTDIDTPEINSDKVEVQKDKDLNKAKPRKLKCEHCKKRFYQEKHLQKHKKTHYPGKGHMRVLFPCKKCDEKFTRFDKLKQHIKTYHDDDDYVPKGEKKKRLYGNPIEASPTELKDMENNPTSVTQSIIQSIKSITYTPKKDNEENNTSNGNNTSQNSTMFSGKRGRGRPPKEKPLIVKPRRPKGRPRIYSELLDKQKQKKPVGRPRKSDTPRKTKILGRKPGRPRKSDQSFFDENLSRSNVSARSGDNYDGASLPYGDLSYLTTGLLNHAGESSSSTTIYDNPLPPLDPLQANSVHTSISHTNKLLQEQQRSISPIDTKSDVPPILTPNKNIMTFIPPIKSETNTTITPLGVNTPPTLEPIIPFRNENITITQIPPPPLIYLKPPMLNKPSTSTASEQSGALNMKKVGDCTIRPLT